MKIIIAVLFTAMVIAGCHKDDTVKPDQSSTTSTTGDDSSTKTTGTGSATNTSAPALTHDDSIHMASFYIMPQSVVTSVSGTNLVLKFNENVNIFFTAEAYQKISAVHLLENFQNTMLSGFDYTTVAEGGNTTTNWVDDNLNNVRGKTVKDTTINKVAMVKINVQRQFTFYKIYSSNQAALNEQAAFLNDKTDLVTFSSYSYYNQKNYPTTGAVAYLVYSK